MIRAVPSPTGTVNYSLTRRGIVILGALFGGGITTLALVIVALFGQHSQAQQQRSQTQKIAGLTRFNQGLLLTLHAEVRHEHLLSLEAKDAYCRLKHYETVSGIAVLRVTVRFHVLTPAAQHRWKRALRGVDAIPAASRCSGAPVGLARRRTSSRRRQGALSSPLRRQASSARRRHVVSRHSRSRRRLSVGLRPATPTSAPVPAVAPVSPPVLNPAGHAPPGLQPGRRQAPGK